MTDVMEICPSEKELIAFELYKCHVEGCTCEFKKESNLKMHLVKHHNIGTMEADVEGGGQMFFCPHADCRYHISSEYGKYFTQKRFLKQHFAKVHTEKKYVCDKCGMKTSIKAVINRHEKVCGVDYSCRVCGWKYNTRETLLVHLMRKHPSEHKAYLGNKPQNKRQTTVTYNTELNNNDIENVISRMDTVRLEHDYTINPNNVVSDSDNEDIDDTEESDAVGSNVTVFNVEDENVDDNNTNVIYETVDNDDIIPLENLHESDISLENNRKYVLVPVDVFKKLVKRSHRHLCDRTCFKPSKRKINSITKRKLSSVRGKAKEPLVTKTNINSNIKDDMSKKRSAEKDRNTKRHKNLVTELHQKNEEIVNPHSSKSISEVGSDFSQYFDSGKHSIVLNNQKLEFQNDVSQVVNEEETDKETIFKRGISPNFNSVDFGCQFDMENMIPDSYDIETQTTFNELCYNDLFSESTNLSDRQTQTVLYDFDSGRENQNLSSVSMQTQTPWSILNQDPIFTSAQTQTSEFSSLYNYNTDISIKGHNFVSTETQTPKTSTSYNDDFDIQFSKEQMSFFTSTETQTMNVASQNEDTLDFSIYDIDKSSSLFESSPHYSFKETQTCFCFSHVKYDGSDNSNLPLIDDVMSKCNCLGYFGNSSPKSGPSTSTETQTQISFNTQFLSRKSDVLLSCSSIETQTCFEDTYLDEIMNNNNKDI